MTHWNNGHPSLSGNHGNTHATPKNTRVCGCPSLLHMYVPNLKLMLTCRSMFFIVISVWCLLPAVVVMASAFEILSILFSPHCIHIMLPFPISSFWTLCSYYNFRLDDTFSDSVLHSQRQVVTGCAEVHWVELLS